MPSAMKQLHRQDISPLESDRPNDHTDAMRTSRKHSHSHTVHPCRLRGVPIHTVAALLVTLGVTSFASCAASAPKNEATRATVLERETPFRRRPLPLARDDGEVYRGVSYGPYREGQRPGGPAPTDAQLLEDLHIIANHWTLLRTYSSDDVTERILSLIHREKLPLKVMLGAWIDTEMRAPSDGKPSESRPDFIAANRRQVSDAIRLANSYPEIVWAVSVGNETQVSWSSHRVGMARLIQHIRRVRSETTVPVTTADDFSFWVTDRGQPLAEEVDFIVVHAYAMWNRQKLSNAMSFTRAKYADTVARHPGLPVVPGEAGWATQKLTYGEQKELIPGVAGEAQQKRYFDAFRSWVDGERIVSFYFEAFDEPWKGGSDPNDVEKHWGLFRVDRTPKEAMKRRTRQ